MQPAAKTPSIFPDNRQGSGIAIFDINTKIFEKCLTAVVSYKLGAYGQGNGFTALVLYFKGCTGIASRRHIFYA